MDFTVKKYRVLISFFHNLAFSVKFKANSFEFCARIQIFKKHVKIIYMTIMYNWSGIWAS
jgi:hypothetical protein